MMSEMKEVQKCVKPNLVLYYLGGGGGGRQGPKNQSRSEWPDTHFGFGNFEIQCNFWNRKNFVSGPNRAT